ncbi:Carcinoembryonic antigen-related cell adhesion molecule 1 [Pseudocercospora fuligena]|uniref:Carcinoembryonic antigen-related cell adhesion molecule 1 n=1 Tax=Pseudocercospora fuligena TaxID=685502 RepID=A0A8H6VPV4_9PEZI|nr:Carcinoembryonic antigen-related cell adhesion molecule 1 [Pseudocercospora fuligena]
MRSRILLTSAAGLTAAQLNAGAPGNARTNAFNGSQLCNREFADAHATGLVSLNPDVGTTNSPISWAGTAYQSYNATGNQNITELSLWFSAGTSNFSNNYELGYDACYMWINQFTLNTFERGQNDIGGCLQALDETCVNDFLDLTNQYSVELTGNPTSGPDSNLTSTSLPTVCADLARMLTNNFPASCKVFFNESLPMSVTGGPPALGGALTGSQSLVNESICTINGSYSLMWSQYGAATQENYYYANYFVAPLITAFMPIADYARPITLASAKSFMTCIRNNRLNPGSEPVPPAPSPTPIDTSAGSSNSSSNSTGSATTSPTSGSSSGGGLSGGAIAGIVIGVIAGLALLAGAAFFLLRKRKGSRAAEVDGSIGRESKGLVEAPHNASISEMDAASPAAQEMSSSKGWHAAELPGQEGQPGGSSDPAELAGHSKQ